MESFVQIFFLIKEVRKTKESSLIVLCFVWNIKKSSDRKSAKYYVRTFKKKGCYNKEPSSTKSKELKLSNKQPV